MWTSLIGFLLVVAIALAVVGAVKRIRLWQQGKPSEVPIGKALAAIPRRYLVDLHDVVARDKAFANTHVATAGGFVASALLMLLVFVLGAGNSVTYALMSATFAAMAFGAVKVKKRRENPPANLSKGPWQRLPNSLLVFSFSGLTISLLLLLGFEHVPLLLATLLLVGIVLGLAELVFGMTWGGPMKHAFAGALHLGFHRRPERFAGGRSTGLKPINLDEERLGADESPNDFGKNH